MCAVALLLACLACAGNARRLQREGEQIQGASIQQEADDVVISYEAGEHRICQTASALAALDPKRLRLFNALTLLFLLFNPIPGSTHGSKDQLKCLSSRAGVTRAGMEDEASYASFRAELNRRGLLSALEELQLDGPSAFKDPATVIEYVMICLQRMGAKGISEAFRFTSPPAGSQSFVSGYRMSGKVVSWRYGKVIEGYASGRTLSLEEFTAELQSSYALLLGCTFWAFAVMHPVTRAPLWKESADGFTRETKVWVDGKLVVMRLIYDWGSWCYTLYNVEVLNGNETSEDLFAADDRKRPVPRRNVQRSCGDIG